MTFTTSLSNRRRVLAGGAFLLAALGGTLAVADLGSATERDVRSLPLPVEPEPALPGALADGRHFGWLRAAYVAPDEIVYDVAELIPGDTDDGAYTVRDIGGGNVVLPVSGAVEVTSVTCDAGCTEGVPTDYATLTRSVDDGAAYWVTVEDGIVVAIDQQYLA